MTWRVGTGEEDLDKYWTSSYARVCMLDWLANLSSLYQDRCLSWGASPVLSSLKVPIFPALMGAERRGDTL